MAEADLAVLRVVVAQLAPDNRRIAEIEGAPVQGGVDRMSPPQIVDEDDVREIREAAAALLRGFREGSPTPPPPSRERFRALLEMLFGHEIDPADVEYWWEESGIDPLSRGVSLDAVPPERREDFEVLVIGAGMNGISAAVHLKAAGIRFRVAERNAGAGGTWFNNTYPGARVDIASRAYSYSFEPGFPWRHYYATQPELLEYFNQCIDKFGVREAIQFETEVRSARWLEASQRWSVELARGDSVETIEVNAIISGVGLFNQPSWPSIRGLDSFGGRLVHTAQWDEDVEVEGKRIAVIGTGSSGVQVVNPLSEVAAQLTVFQRAGTWLANVPNYKHQVPEGERWLLEHCPYYLNWMRLTQVYAIGDTRLPMVLIDPEWTEPNTVSSANLAFRDSLMAYLTSKLGDRPELMEACVPAYPPLAKRLPKDNGWYDAIREEHVELVGEAIEEVTPNGIRTVSGEERPFDLIILATGFDANNYLGTLNLQGRGGITLAEAWQRDGARAHLGITIPGFPNLFCLYGPNTNGPVGTPFSWGEMQVRYAIRCMERIMLNGTGSVEVEQEVFSAFNELLDERMQRMIWMDQRQSSYYRNEFNRVAINGAWTNSEYWKWTLQPGPDDLVER